MRLVGVVGSLRKESYNRKLMQAAVAVLPQGCTLEIIDLADIPLYNQELESTLPDSVKKLREKILSADGIVIVTPEYNYSIPGVLKNALDWASRPSGANAWDQKPVAIMGASLGVFGTVRAQNHLRQICFALNMFPINRPEVLIGSAADKFDAQGDLTDLKAVEKIRDLLKALAAAIK